MVELQSRPWLTRTARALFYVFARPMQKLYWFVVRPYRPGVKTFVFRGEKLLLVRLGYAHKKWVLPGGGIDGAERPLEAAAREVKEEAGVVVSNLTYIGKRFNTLQYKKVDVFYYTTETETKQLVIDGQEIIDAGWFSLDAIPPESSPRLQDEIIMYTTWKYGTN